MADLGKPVVWKPRSGNFAVIKAGPSKNIAFLAGSGCCCLMEMVPARLPPAPSLTSHAVLSQDRSIGTRDFMCNSIALVGPPLGRQITVSRSYVGGSAAFLLPVGSDMPEIRPVSRCLFHGHTLRLIPIIKRLGFLKYQHLSAPLAGANRLAHRCGKA